jgi:uncharacterized protein YjbI with pentapeptide repeats
MADPTHLRILLEGAEVWNEWRSANPSVRPDLSEARLVNADLSRAVLDGANLKRADLSKAQLSHATLQGADLESATLILADLLGAVLNEANLSGASFFGAFLFGTRLKSANLSGANLLGATLMGADLTSADLTGCHLMAANFHEANLSGARLAGADLTAASLVGTRVEGAEFDGCSVHGISTWNLEGRPLRETGLVVTTGTEFPLLVDDLEVAQHLGLILYGKTAPLIGGGRDSRMVLAMGRFRSERRWVAEELSHEVARRGWAQVTADLDRPTRRDGAQRIARVARASRLLVFDLTGVRSPERLFDEFFPDGIEIPLLLLAERGQVSLASSPLWERAVHSVQYAGADELVSILQGDFFPVAESPPAD